MTDSILNKYFAYSTTTLVPFPFVEIPAGALGLLYGETDGFAIDATTESGTVGVIDTATPANDLSNVTLDASTLVQASTSAKLVSWNSTPFLRWTPHNMFLNSGAPATQNVTLVTGFQYTVSVTGGGGSITGSAGASGVATTGSPNTFTATTTTGTFTYAATLTTIQLNRGPIATPYLATTGSQHFGVPQGYDSTRSLFGILIEPAATNLMLRSEDFATTWNLNGGSVSSNATTAPDGATTADTLTFIDAQVTSQYLTTTSDAVYTASLHLKYDTTRWICVQQRSAAGAGRVRVWFDVQNGVLGSSSVAGTGTYLSSFITSIGNGWYRCTVTGSMTHADVGVNIFAASADANTTAIAGSVHVWGAQFETGYIATSNIQTVSASATRASDDVTAPMSTMPYDNAAGTMYADAMCKYSTANAPGYPIRYARFDDDTNTDAVDLTFNSSGEQFSVTTSNVGQATIIAGSASSAGTRRQLTGAWADNDFDTSLNGATTVTDPSGTVPTVMVTFRVGNRALSADRTLNGYLYRLVYVPRQVETDGGNIETWRYNF